MASALRGQTFATCSMASTASINVPPVPPSASGIVMPSKPIAAMRFATSRGNSGAWARASAPAASSLRAKAAIESQNRRC